MTRKLISTRAKKEFKRITQQVVRDLSQPLVIVQESPMFVDCPNCFEAGTLVETPFGLKNISEFVPGDLILDGLGNPRLVDKTFEREGLFDFCKIKTHGNSIGLEATTNHKIPVYSNLGTAYSPILGERREEEIGLVEKGELVGKAIRPLPQDPKEKLYVDWKSNSFGPQKTLPNYIEVSSELLFSIGLYLAEGVTSKGRVVSYCLNKGELEIGNRVCKFWSDLTDSTFSLYGRGETENAVFELYSSHLADLLDRWCGHGAENKKIPEPLYYQLNVQQTMSLLFGLLVGDGHYEKEYESVVVSTVSKQLAYQVYNLLLSCGYSTSILSSPSKVGKDGIHRKEYYTVRYWPDKDFVQRGTVRTENSVFQVVKEVERCTKTSRVYNVEVQTEHSYIASGFSVNNCIWDSINRKSSNIFDASFVSSTNIFVGTDQQRTISPVSFSSGRCPVCIGEGQLFTNKEVCIPAMINFIGPGASGGKFQDTSAGKEGVNYAIVKTLACYYDLLARNNVFIIHTNIKCEKFRPPFVRGMGGEEAVVEMVVQTTEAGQLSTGKFDSSDHPYRRQDEDPRRKIKGPTASQILRGSRKGQGG